MYRGYCDDEVRLAEVRVSIIDYIAFVYSQRRTRDTNLHSEKQMDDSIKKIYDSIIGGNQKTVTTQVQAALDAGIDPGAILNDGMIAAMTEVGRLFECGEYYVPEMLIAARAMKAGLALLRPKLATAHVQSIGKVVIGTVQGDLHDIGKNLVAMMLEGAGLEVIDLGIDVPPSKFVEAIKQHQPQFVGLSAMLTTTMPNMKTTVDALTAAGVRGAVKVMIGGAPVTERYAREIGADIYTSNASSAAARAKEAMASNLAKVGKDFRTE